MATVLLVEDAPDLGLYEAGLLRQAGHRTIQCSGGPGPSPSSACPLLRTGSCSLADAADLILFSGGLFSMRGRNYSGEHLIHAYRSHPRYGRLPMLVVSVGRPRPLGGSGPFEHVEKFSAPFLIVEAVERLLGLRLPAGAPEGAGSCLL